MNFETIKNKKIKYLQHVKELLNNTPAPSKLVVTFSIEKIKNNYSEIIKEITGTLDKNQYYVYVFGCDFNIIPAEKLKLSIQEAKAKSKKETTISNKIAFCRINKQTDPKCLYVGSCRTNFIGRIKQHMGYGHNHTYSLQLSRWCDFNNLEINLSFFPFSNELDNNILQLIEDGVWEEYRPLLGKKGAK